MPKEVLDVILARQGSIIPEDKPHTMPSAPAWAEVTEIKTNE